MNNRAECLERVAKALGFGPETPVDVLVREIHWIRHQRDTAERECRRLRELLEDCVCDT